MDDTRDEVGEILAGMTGGRTGTAGGVSSPVPPAADWPRGLDAASASAGAADHAPVGRVQGSIRARNRRPAWPRRSSRPCAT